ncbi:MAG: hypothetical protein ACRD2U_04530 [Terriglobales bacterium]
MTKRFVHIVFLFVFVFAFAFAFGASASAADATVAVVVGQNAPELDKFAASELCGYLSKLFGVKVQPTTKMDHAALAVFLIGSPATNPAIKSFPQVSDQGIVIQRLQGRPAVLVIGGGSPKATLWAVYELAERWGVRYLLNRDALPSRSAFSMPDLHVVMEPIFRVRAHGTTNVDFADSGEAWGINDFRRLIDQLAKMKYNRLNVGGYAWQPYLEYQVDGIKRQTATLWYGYHYPITPDMPGRSAFPAEMTEFWNPDLPVHGTPDELLDAGVRLQHELIEYGNSRGMECVTSATVSEYPKEFAPLLGGAVPIHMINQLTTTPGPDTKLDDPGLHKLSSTVVRTTIDTYPQVDRINISINEWRQWTDQYKRAWDALDAKYHIGEATTLEHVLDASRHRAGYAWGAAFDKAALEKKASDEVKGDLASLYFFDWLVKDSGAVSESKRPDMKFLYWGFAEELYPILPKVLPANSELEVMPDNFLDHLLKRSSILKELSGGPIQPIINLTMDDDNIGIVPQMTTSALQKVLAILRETKWEGVVTRERFPGDHDTERAYLARASWDPNADPDKIALEELQAACGQRCGEDLLTTMHSIDDATHVWERDDEHFAFPVPSLLMKYWKAGPLPDYLEENRENYERGWESARHAVALATPEGKSYAEYWAKRMEFATKYVTVVQFVRRAATAEDAHQIQAAVEETAKALATLRESLDAYATVARTPSDRGAIAVAVEYGYRPLEKKMSALKQESVNIEPAGKNSSR